MTNEVKVGLFFLVGMALVIALTFFSSDLARSKTQFTIYFHRVLQLKDGDPVTYNGVRVGTVSSVAPDVDNKGLPTVAVGFSIEGKARDKVLVDDKTRYRILLGVLGGATLEISSEASGEPITAKALVGKYGEPTAGISEAVAKVNELIDENRPDIKQAVEAVKTGMTKLGELSDELKSVIKDNHGSIGDSIGNFGRMSKNIADLVEENREMVGKAVERFEEMSREIGEMVKENRPELKKAIDELPTTVKNFGDMSKRLDEFIAANSEDFRTTMKNIAAFSERLTRIGENVEVVSKQIAEGKGSLGKLVFQDTLHDSAVAATTNLNQRLEEVKPFTSGLIDLKLYAGVYGGTNTETEASTAGAYLRIEPRSYKYYEGGISYRTGPEDRIEADEDPNDLNIDFNLLLGWRFFPDDSAEVYRLTVAGGIIESRIGGRIEIPVVGERLRLVSVIRDKHSDREVDDRRFEDGKAMLRTTLEYKPFARYGIYLAAGVDDIIDDPAPWIGIRAELLDNDLRNLTTISGLKP
jgi:ABC-type transporter Mla subunit MlaD